VRPFGVVQQCLLVARAVPVRMRGSPLDLQALHFSRDPGERFVLVSENPLRGDGLFALSCIDGRAWPKLHLLATAALIEFKASSEADAHKVFDYFFLASGPGGVMLLQAPPECQSQAVGQQTSV